MTWSMHHTIAAATSAIIVTLVICTVSINHSVRKYSGGDYSAYDLSDIEKSLEQIEENTTPARRYLTPEPIFPPR